MLHLLANVFGSGSTLLIQSIGRSIVVYTAINFNEFLFTCETICNWRYYDLTARVPAFQIMLNSCRDPPRNTNNNDRSNWSRLAVTLHMFPIIASLRMIVGSDTKFGQRDLFSVHLEEEERLPKDFFFLASQIISPFLSITCGLIWA